MVGAVLSAGGMASWGVTGSRRALRRVPKSNVDRGRRGRSLNANMNPRIASVAVICPAHEPTSKRTPLPVPLPASSFAGRGVGRRDAGRIVFMGTINQPFCWLGALLALCLAVTPAQAQPAAAPDSASPAPATTNNAPRAARGGPRGDPRVQNRTYPFTNTGEMLPYAVFVSSKVVKEKKAPLILALRGAGGNPTVFLQGAALNLAEEGGYILAGAMGYNSMGSFGMPASGRGGPGGRGGAPNGAARR